MVKEYTAKKDASDQSFEYIDLLDSNTVETSD